MILSYWTLAVALSLSLIAAWYSIAGLTAIFAAAAVPIMIMGGIMEVAKITVTVWLHEYWTYAKRSLKVQLTASVVLLMFITSMGIFGFLSKAHSDQALVSGDVGAKIAIYDEKIRIAKDNIEANRKALTQMDAAVDQTMSRSNDEKGADKAVAIRRSQGAERSRLLKEIEVEQKKIQKLNEEAAPIRAEIRKVEAEVGPIKYIAALIYGDNPDANLLERAVRWVIIILVIVFDPLAIAMVLSATESLKWEKQWKGRKPDPIDEPEDREVESWFERAKERARFWDKQPKVNDLVEQITPENVHKEQLSNLVIDEPQTEDQHTHIPVKTYYASIKPRSQFEPTPEEDQELAQDPMIAPTAEIVDTTPDLERPGDYLYDPEKEAIRQWKADHPEDTIKHQRELHETGRIAKYPWEDYLGLNADNDKLAGNVTGFGIEFPATPTKGDMFLRVDQMPSVLYKFNGTRWIEVDKNRTDQYAYDTAYIDHLIAKIESGEYDPELLSDAEREQIEQRLKNA